MELFKTSGILHISTGDVKLVEELLKSFNAVYKNSKLKYLSSEIIDGVRFCYIDAREADVNHIFLFGYNFGDKIRQLRDNGQIDW